MTLANSLSSFVAWTFCAALCIGNTCSAAAPDAAPAASEVDVTYFYKNPSPERVTKLIAYFDTLSQTGNRSAQPPTIGFLAAAFQRYPNDIDKMIPAGLSTPMQAIVATSLQLAGQDTRAKSLVDHLRAAGAATPDLRYVPSLDAVPVTGPSEFDLLWGASFASGDPRYTLKILEHLAGIANVDGNAEDMMNIARSYGSGADMHWVVQKRGADMARQLISQSAGLWALYSNSVQHEFIRAAVAKYTAAHPDEPMSKALTALSNQYGHYETAKVISLTETGPGKHSATINVGYLSRILDDLARHAGTYPVHFQFPDDRPRAERDVSAISGLLDPLSQDFARNAPLQLRLGLLHAIGFNLDIPDSHDKAVAAFSTVMQLTPDDPQANYQYGAFLAATTKKGEGIPFLEKARNLGVANADYWLGWSYVSVGDKTKAIENLENYTKRVPGDQNAARVLDAVRKDKLTFEERKTSP